MIKKKKNYVNNHTNKFFERLSTQFTSTQCLLGYDNILKGLKPMSSIQTYDMEIFMLNYMSNL